MQRSDGTMVRTPRDIGRLGSSGIPRQHAHFDLQELTIRERSLITERTCPICNRRGL